MSTLKEKHSELEVKILDLFNTDLPEVLGGDLDAKYAIMGGQELNEQSKNSFSETSRIANEFLQTDIYLISSPMWNFTIPYKLKHYIDVIMQAGILFTFTKDGVEGLVKGKKMFCVTSRGSDFSSGPDMHKYGFQEPNLRSIFGFAGIYDISFINAQPMDYMP